MATSRATSEAAPSQVTSATAPAPTSTPTVSAPVPATASTGARLLDVIKVMPPADFAAVMSTGIVSIALHLLGHNATAQVLFRLNTALFLILGISHLVRAVRFPAAVKKDVESHPRGPGFLTMVAGTCILGNQFVLMDSAPGVGLALLTLGATLWVLFLWGVFFAIFVEPGKPALGKGINGGWLLATVSTQALVILGTLCLEHAPWDRELARFIFAALFGLGFMLYLFVIGCIFYRYSFKELAPEDLSPTYWINTGAVAITTLAGAELITHAEGSPFLQSMLPFLKGMTVMAWATACWWLPMLFLLGFWRIFVKRFPLVYSPEYWGMVFPMGMFTACTFMLSKAVDMPALLIIPQLFIVVALVCWAMTFYGMCTNLWKNVFSRQ